jgi:hypothetical protein
MIRIEATPGFILTNGDMKAYATTIEANDINEWYEIVDNTKKD